MSEIGLDWLAANPLPQPDSDTNKNERGRVLVVGGSERVPGALRLTGEAALRAGAGKVQLATVERAAIGLGVAMPEAAVFGLPANAHGELGADAIEPVRALVQHCDALVLGPGMGADAEAEALLVGILAAAGRECAILIDAGAIGDCPPMAEAIRAHPGPVVLTPHAGEMALLMDCDEQDVTEADASLAAGRYGATIVLKRADSWIAGPGVDVHHYEGGGPGLATAGSGDVLAGIIGGLLARGASPEIATGWGVWLHGEAGRRLAARIGPTGFLARELLPEIPALMVTD
jgi:hydroxyethylthiazole kinase-like uncharacterized protein yjeF